MVRFDFVPVQRELFIREAKIMTDLHHEYIMKFYGAIVLGPYAYSVGLVSLAFVDFLIQTRLVLTTYYISMHRRWVFWISRPILLPGCCLQQ